MTQTSNDQELAMEWLRCAQSAAPIQELDPNLLAAYLDGSATDAEKEAIEAMMALNGDIIEDITELRALMEVTEDKSAKVIPLAPWRHYLRATITAAAAVAALAIGYDMGLTGEEEGYPTDITVALSQEELGQDHLVGLLPDSLELYEDLLQTDNDDIQRKDML